MTTGIVVPVHISPIVRGCAGVAAAATLASSLAVAAPAGAAPAQATQTHATQTRATTAAVTTRMVTTAAPDPAPSSVWGYPLANRPGLLRSFDGPRQRWDAGHRGVDLAASIGQEVLAPREGVVTFSGPVAGRVVLTITHPDGLRSSLEALSDAVPAGTAVARGDVVARVAPPLAGHCASTCLHWGVRRGETYIDPLSLLVRRYAVLLPWEG